MFKYELTTTNKGGKTEILFENNFSAEANEEISNIFRRLGGNLVNENNWKFPSNMSTVVLKTIIDNTCFKCGGIVNDAEALQNTLLTSDDFGNDSGDKGTTQTRVGTAIKIKCRKCIDCGHSFNN